MVKGCIYIIKNRKNNAVYIGQTILPVKDRFSQHMKPSAHKKNYKFYRAISKLGKESFYNRGENAPYFSEGMNHLVFIAPKEL